MPDSEQEACDSVDAVVDVEAAASVEEKVEMDAALMDVPGEEPAAAARVAPWRRGEVAVLAVLLLAVVVSVLLACWPARSHIQDTPVCTRPACLLAAAQIVGSINASADPCSRFCAYACGSTHHILLEPASHTYSGRLQTLISRAPQPGPARSVAWKMLHLYESCMALDIIETDGDRPLRRVIDLLGGWQVLRDFSVLTWNYREQLVTLHAKLGATPFFRVAAMPDPTVPSLFVLQISPAGLSLPDRSYYYDQHNWAEESYKQYAQDAARQLGATSADARAFGEELFHFEKRLAEVTPPGSQLHRLAAHDKLPLAQLADKVPSIPLHDIIAAKYPNARINDSTPVLATSIKYLTQISNILTSSDRQVLNNYMMWSFVSGMLPYLSNEYRNIVHIFQEKLSGSKQRQPRWQMCIHSMRKYMGLALAVLHDRDISVESRSEAKEVVNAMFETLHDAVKDLIEDSGAPAYVRQYTVDKVNAMALQVGYPSHMLTDTFLEEYYTDLFVQKNNFFQNIQYGISFLQSVEERHLMKPTDHDMWMFVMSNEDTISYIPVSNKVIVPHRLLLTPDFHPNYPLVVLYARVGTRMAEAMARAILPYGILHGSDGALTTDDTILANWTAQLVWSAERCLNAVEPSQPTDQRAALDLLAQTVALRAAYHASSNAVLQLDHIHQPALEHFEDSTLFFIAYAQSSCCKSSEPWRKYFGNMETFHSPSHKILELLLKESQEFGETFKCMIREEYHNFKECKHIL